jgi:hypothetical protein
MFDMQKIRSVVQSNFVAILNVDCSNSNRKSAELLESINRTLVEILAEVRNIDQATATTAAAPTTTAEGRRKGPVTTNSIDHAIPKFILAYISLHIYPYISIRIHTDLRILERFSQKA